MEKLFLRQAIQEVQKIGRKHGFNIIIIGGAVVRFFGKKTAIVKIDEGKRIITVKNAENPGIRREEHANTLIDIDAIAFSTSPDPFTMEVKQAYAHLMDELHALKNSDPDFPPLSIEPVLYHPFFPKPHGLMQFVSSIESYHNHNFFFRLGSVKIDVQKKSLEPWTIAFADSNETITTLMPPAIQRRYAIRGFSIKPKDKEKIWGDNSPFAQFVANFRVKTKGIYDQYFTQWDDFAEKIKQSQQPSMVIKKTLWNTYWQTVGTYLAHGTGPIGKHLLPLGNTLFAGRK